MPDDYEVRRRRSSQREYRIDGLRDALANQASYSHGLHKSHSYLTPLASLTESHTDSHDIIHERDMGLYFQDHYVKGERIEIPKVFEEGKNREWNKWKERRLQDLRFYDENNMRTEEYAVTSRAPPRIHLRGYGKISSSSLTNGHLEFKVWLQNKVEEASTGRGSTRFLSEQDREVEHEGAMDMLDLLGDEFEDLFRARYFTKSNIEDSRFRFSRHLLLLRKITARHQSDFDVLTRDQWVHPDNQIPTLNSNILDHHSILGRICREAIRILIGSSKSYGPSPAQLYREIGEAEEGAFTLRRIADENSISIGDDENPSGITKKLVKAEVPPPLEWESMKWINTTVPAMSFIEKLQQRIHGIISEACEMARKYSPDKMCGPEGMEFDEAEALEQIIENGFGNIGGNPMTPEKRTEHSSVRLAYDIMLMLLDEELLQREYMSEREYLDHFQRGEEALEKPRLSKRLPHQLVFSRKLKDIIGNSDYEHFSKDKENPIYRWLRSEQDRWMYCPPIRHRYGTPPSKGGLLTDSNRRIIGGSHDIYDEFGTPRCVPSKRIVDTLNILQDTQWEINLDFLSLFFDVELIDKTLLPSEGWRDKSSRINSITPKQDFIDVFTPEDPESRANRKLVLEWSRRIIEHNANVFWHSWICDFRGRMSPRCPKLSPQGDDLDRAMIRFKHWKPLGEDGIFWLRVHVHNMMEGIESSLIASTAKKGRTFRQRSDWVKDNLNALITMASNPEDYRSELKLDRYIPGKSETFQRLAALIELSRVQREWENTHEDSEKRDWSKVKSGQPVYLDASCNGYQHVAALLRDRDLAEKVNIVNTGEISDLYGIVADNANSSLARGLFSELLSEEEDIIEGLKRTFSRGTAKLPTMTRVYGSKDIVKCLHGRNGRGSPKYSDPVPWELSKEEGDEFDNIPAGFIDAYREYINEPSLSRRHYLKNSKNTRGKTDHKKASRWVNLIEKRKSLPLWNDGSGLQMALLTQRDKISDAFSKGEGWQNQPKLTKMVASSYAESIGKSTDKAFDKLEKPLGSIVNSSDAMHPGITWTLDDGFVVRNYYIKHHQANISRGGMPCHTGSTFSPMIPDWYKKKTKSIFARVQELYSGDERVVGDKELEAALSASLDGKMENLEINRSKVERILLIVDPDRENDEANEIRKVMRHPNVTLLRYDEKEKNRLNRKKFRSGLAPNFVHSLDAYHMRTTIYELFEQTNPLSFWAVHDAFGTHPCDVPLMREMVKKTFLETHKERDLRDWLEAAAKPFEIDFDKDFLDSNSSTMLRDVWDHSKTTLDISDVASAEYIIS